jgi:hypothetical protein
VLQHGPGERRAASGVRRLREASRAWLHGAAGQESEAEGGRFELPTRRMTGNGFRDRRIRPLCHPSALSDLRPYLMLRRVITAGKSISWHAWQNMWHHATRRGRLFADARKR